MPTFGSLFSGIGGMDLGLERAGWTCNWQVEIDDYCRRVLEKHWPDVPRYGDVRDCHELPYVDLIAGGFPCQDISVAGKGAGIEGARSGLWSEFNRIIREVRPRLVLVENVPALLRRGMWRVLGNLAESGYDAEWDCIPAAAVGAPHLRDRVFIMAYAYTGGRDGRTGVFRQGGRGQLEDSSTTLADAVTFRCDGRANNEGQGQAERDGSTSGRTGERALADADGQRLAIRQGATDRRGVIWQEGETAPPGSWWAVEPDFCRMVDGISKELERGGLDARSRLGAEGYPTERDEGFMRVLWDDVIAVATSRGWRQDEQLGAELAYLLLLLPHEASLGAREAALEAARYVFGMRQACSSLGFVSDPSQSLSEAWRSASEEDQGWLDMAARAGVFVNEWPGVPRVATAINQRVDRLKGLGNAVVPQVAEWIGRRLLEAIDGD